MKKSPYFCIRFRENFSGFNAPSFFSDRVGKSSLKGLHTETEKKYKKQAVMAYALAAEG